MSEHKPEYSIYICATCKRQIHEGYEFRHFDAYHDGETQPEEEIAVVPVPPHPSPKQEGKP